MANYTIFHYLALLQTSRPRAFARIVELKPDYSVYYTRVKTHKLLQVCKQVVTSLFTSCQQDVFALLVPSLL